MRKDPLLTEKTESDNVLPSNTAPMLAEQWCANIVQLKSGSHFEHVKSLITVSSECVH